MTVYYRGMSSLDSPVRRRGRPRKVFRWAALCRNMELASVSADTLASVVGVKLRTVEGWRRGEKRPEIPRLKSIAIALGCDWKELAE